MHMTTIPIHMYTQNVKRTNNSSKAVFVYLMNVLLYPPHRSRMNPTQNFTEMLKLMMPYTDQEDFQKKKKNRRRNTTAHIFN